VPLAVNRSNSAGGLRLGIRAPDEIRPLPKQIGPQTEILPVGSLFYEITDAGSAVTAPKERSDGAELPGAVAEMIPSAQRRAPSPVVRPLID
jgi:hypothetical protein